MNRTVSLVGISSTGSRPGHGAPFIVTTPVAEPGTEYCGYWNCQLHWEPVTVTTTSGCGGSLSM